MATMGKTMIDSRKLADFTSKINNLFGLEEQSRELIALVTEATGCHDACLLFPEFDGEDFSISFSLPQTEDTMSRFSLKRDNPIVEYLGREKRLLTRASLATLPEFLQRQKTGEIKLNKIELFVPLVSRDRLIGILVLGAKQSGSYSAKDFRLVEGIVGRVAVSLEKEYLRQQLAQLYAEVAEKARVDGLTGLLNRRSLDEMLASEINRHSRYGGIFSLIILDIDSLKAVNDRYGHLAGDELLRRVGGIIKNAIRGADQAFRYGGDEFAVLLPNTSLDAASRVAERIRTQVASEPIAGGMSATVSLGLASWPTYGKGANEVMGAADAALYQVKRSGGNSSQRAENPQ